MTGQRKIVDGPNKFDFMASLFDGKVTTFTIEGLAPMRIKVVGVRLEDGSYQRWLFEFRLAEHMSAGVFKGYFDTRTRTGWVESSQLNTSEGLDFKRIVDQLAH